MSKRSFFCVIIAVSICTLFIPDITLSEELRDYDSMLIVVDNPLQADFDAPTGESSTIPVAEGSNAQEATPTDAPASTPAATQDDASSTLDDDEGSLIRAQKRLITLGY